MRVFDGYNKMCEQKLTVKKLFFHVYFILWKENRERGEKRENERKNQTNDDFNLSLEKLPPEQWEDNRI